VAIVENERLKQHIEFIMNATKRIPDFLPGGPFLVIQQTRASTLPVPEMLLPIIVDDDQS
jgi:hypothetical protein